MGWFQSEWISVSGDWPILSLKRRIEFSEWRERKADEEQNSHIMNEMCSICRDWIADLVSLLAIKRNRTRHDIPFITRLTHCLCSHWPFEHIEQLSNKISQRMFEEKRTVYSRLYHFIRENVFLKQNEQQTKDVPPLLRTELAKFDRTNYTVRSKLWRSPL
jgi:hypothetical protein